MDLHNSSGPRDPPSLPRSGTRIQARASTGGTDSVERSARVAAIRDRLDALAGHDPLLRVSGLVAGYGATEILHGIDLKLGAGQWLCLVGPNGAGKSTLLHSIFGLTDIRAGRIEIGNRNVTRLGPNAKLRDAGVAYVLHDSSVFPDMTVEQNLWLGGYLRGWRAEARHAAEQVFERCPSLATQRNAPARELSCGERRLLEISRALVMRPRLLLVDEPAGGLDQAVSDTILAMLLDLRDHERLSIVTVEPGVQRGLAVADIGCMMIAGEIAVVGSGAELLADPRVGQLHRGR